MGFYDISIYGSRSRGRECGRKNRLLKITAVSLDTCTKKTCSLGVIFGLFLGTKSGKLVLASLAGFKVQTPEYFLPHEAYDFLLSFPLLSVWEVGFIICA